MKEEKCQSCQELIQTALHALRKAVKIVFLLLFAIFPRYLPTYCLLLWLSALYRHEGDHGLAKQRE